MTNWSAPIIIKLIFQTIETQNKQSTKFQNGFPWYLNYLKQLNIFGIIIAQTLQFLKYVLRFLISIVVWCEQFGLWSNRALENCWDFRKKINMSGIWHLTLNRLKATSVKSPGRKWQRHKRSGLSYRWYVNAALPGREPRCTGLIARRRL